MLEDWYYTYACDDCKKNGTEVLVVKTLVDSPFIKVSYATAETHVGCWAHARRKFIEAIEAKKGDSIAAKDLTYCEQLFQIEDTIAELSIEDKFAYRQEKAVPLLNEFKAWADQQRVSAKSKIGKALTYLDNQWKYLVNYVMDGRL